MRSAFRGPAHQLAVRMRINNCNHGHNYYYSPSNQPCTMCQQLHVRRGFALPLKKVLVRVNNLLYTTTVEPPNNGRDGSSTFVHYSEVSFMWRFFYVSCIIYPLRVMIDAYTITTDMIMIFSRILTHSDEWLR